MFKPRELKENNTRESYTYVIQSRSNQIRQKPTNLLEIGGFIPKKNVVAFIYSL